MLEQRSLLTTFTVNSLADTADATPGDGVAVDLNGETSLRAALEEANAFAGADVIEFNDGSGPGVDFYDITPDTITLGGTQLTISSDVTINGAGANLLTVSGNDASGVFRIDGNSDVILDSLSIVDGRTSFTQGGGIRNSSTGEVVVSNSMIVGNSASNGGGVWNNGQMILINSTVANNSTQSGSGGGFGGGVLNRGGALQVINSTLSGNSGTRGGGLYTFSGGSVALTNVTVTDNTAQSGGGLFRSGSTMTVNNSIVSGNSTGNVQGNFSGSNNLIGGTASNILLPTLANNGGPTLTHALLPTSPARDAGADGLALDQNASALTGDQRGAAFTRFAGNVDIGAIEFQEAKSLIVTTQQDVVDPLDNLTSLREALAFANSNANFSEITFGDGSGLSGGTDFTDATADTITLNGEQLEITSDLTISAPGANLLAVSGNDSSRVFKVTSGDVVLAGLTVTEGQTTSANPLADRTGAGLKIESGASVQVLDSSFSGNDAAGAGGQGSNGLNGGAVWNAGTLEILNSSFSTNSARANGGTIWNSGDLSVVNSTIVGGRARINGGGGGGALFNEGAASFLNATVSGNRAVLGGGFYNVGTLTSSNSVVAGNVAGKDVFGAATGQNNLIGDAANAGGLVDGTDGNIVGVDWTTVLENDGLDPTLANNGGQTSTVALLSGSIALNAGDDVAAAALATDQRGENRFVGTVDIGAFEVQNQVPTADAGGPYTVVEGSDVSLDGAGSSDPDNDTLTYEWDFNYDGTTFDVDATGETPDFIGIDDGDVTVALRVSDGSELSEIVTTTVTVTNADPAISGLTTDSATLASKSDDGVVTLSGSVTDAGTLDTHEVVVDWGDGNVETIVAAGDLVTSPDFSGTQHTYAAGGIYTITVTVTDDDSGSLTQTTSAVVQGVGVVDGVLYVIGTNGDDVVKMREKNHGTQLRVKTKFDGGSTTTQYFEIADIDRIEMHLCDGDDYASLTQAHWWHKHSVDISATINGGDGDDVLIGGSQADVIDGGNGDDCLHGESGDDTIHGGEGDDWIVGGWGDDIVYAGAGNDWVWGGFGNDILLGQSGNDRLFGGWGRDIIIAGEGADLLFGQGQDDILITGDTNWDDDEDALQAMRDAWTGSGSASSRAQAIQDSGLEVMHDDDVDKVWGGWGLDWVLSDGNLDRAYC